MWGTYVWISVHVPLESRSQPWVLLFHWCESCFGRQRLSARLTDHWTLGDLPASASPKQGFQVAFHHAWLSTWILEDWTQVLVLVQSSLTDWAASPVPRSTHSRVKPTGTSYAELHLIHLTGINVLSFLEDTYERTLVVDGESATIILLDMWENKVCRAGSCQRVPSGLAFQQAAWCQSDLVLHRRCSRQGGLIPWLKAFTSKERDCAGEQVVHRRALKNKQIAVVCPEFY